MDIHQATISVTVRDDAGKLVMESAVETKAATILDFIRGVRGSYPRMNAVLKKGNKNDRMDARKLSDLLRAGLLSPVYHGDSGVRTLRELARSYLTETKDLSRVMNRLKGLYRSWGIPCAGQTVYSTGHRNEWLAKLAKEGVRRRAEWLYNQLDSF
jgi:hypothetical protein